MGRAVARSWADGADALGGRLQGSGWSLVEAVLLRPGEMRENKSYVKKKIQSQCIFVLSSFFSF